MVRIFQIQRERPNLMPPFAAGPNKSYRLSIGGNRKQLNWSFFAEQPLRVAGTIAADPRHAEFTVARWNIRTVNDMLSVRHPDRLPVQGAIESQPGYRAALKVVHEEVSRRRQR